MANSNQRHIESIKALTLSFAGIKEISLNQCRRLSFSIIERTRFAISEITLKRLFGLETSKFSPSLYTLNGLAVYCGYESWELFCKVQPADLTGTDDVFSHPLMTALLETAIPTIILKANTPDFTIVTYNKAYEVVTNTQKRNIKNLTVWEAFNPEKAGGAGPTKILEAFREAVYTQRTVQMEPLHYNIPSIVPNVIALNWWDVKIVPVVYDRIVKYLLINTYNITDKILHQDAIEQAIMKELTMAEDLASTNIKLSTAIKSLAESNEELVNTKKQLEEVNLHLEQRVFERTKKLFESEANQWQLINNAPVAIGVIKGPKHIIETANKKIIEYWGKDSSVIGKPLAEAIPELDGQPFIGMLDNVRSTGVPYINPELCAFLDFHGNFQPRYFDMVYHPIQHAPGVTDSIFIVAVDITDHVLARKNLEQLESILRLAVNAANIGTWSFETKNRVLSYNSIFAKISGWNREEKMTYEQSMAQITAEFRAKISEVIEMAILNNKEFNFTYAHKGLTTTRSYG